ncbi:MAG: 4Fe-4S binding protein [bacterium]|nr:4Fe-4S binding protein [bacterium]
MGVQLGAVKRRPKGPAAYWNVQNARHLVQAGFLATVVNMAVQRALAAGGAFASTPPPEAYCPFGGIETLYRWVTTGKYINHAAPSNLIVLGAVLLGSLALKSSFCGWICPFGTLQEALTGITRFFERRFRPVARLAKTLKAHTRGLEAVDRYLRWGKYLVLAYFLYGTIVAARMVFRPYDPYITALNINEATLGPGLIILISTVVLSFFMERPWCKYLCPLSPIVGLVGKLAPVKIERTGTYCKDCSICGVTCPMNLPLATATRVTAVDCNDCLKCVGACPRAGALDLVLRWPWAKPAVLQ